MTAPPPTTTSPTVAAEGPALVYVPSSFFRPWKKRHLRLLAHATHANLAVHKRPPTSSTESESAVPAASAAATLTLTPFSTVQVVEYKGRTALRIDADPALDGHVWHIVPADNALARWLEAIRGAVRGLQEELQRQRAVRRAATANTSPTRAAIRDRSVSPGRQQQLDRPLPPVPVPVIAPAYEDLGDDRPADPRWAQNTADAIIDQYGSLPPSTDARLPGGSYAVLPTPPPPPVPAVPLPPQTPNLTRRDPSPPRRGHGLAGRLFARSASLQRAGSNGGGGGRSAAAGIGAPTSMIHLTPASPSSIWDSGSDLSLPYSPGLTSPGLDPPPTMPPATPLPPVPAVPPSPGGPYSVGGATRPPSDPPLTRPPRPPSNPGARPGSGSLARPPSTGSTSTSARAPSPHASLRPPSAGSTARSPSVSSASLRGRRNEGGGAPPPPRSRSLHPSAEDLGRAMRVRERMSAANSGMGAGMPQMPAQVAGGMGVFGGAR
ncbi:hypothetical protein AMAG_13457 [Allomyces macrogynus ATCC 38327]|uniref:PH domain-containing protein n=1 Tax=Allomyces macrogynus (strain ATCC 38327) TaxID=578462 RepID=A0A0L0T271_ALLM3|nr:hypothetical protein AMAG_13457 [Allomyces macrogynus ATCC 38327]|eukprot:KNE68817.1 hypothetical protein AMAG_13457 [Allomyces macrogynus ATCC 38327]